MAWLRSIASGLRAIFRKDQVDRELDEELRGYLEMAAEEKVQQGMIRNEAARTVRLEQGSAESAKEIIGTAGWESLVETFWQDLRLAVRTLRKSRGFVAVATLTLALGIGANAAIFTLIHSVMLRPLPVVDPGQLYRLGDNNNCCVMVGTQNDGSFVLYSFSLYEYLRDQTGEFAELAAFASFVADLSVRARGSTAEPYKGEFVSGNYFAMFGIRASAGRLLAPQDDTAGAPRVAVMSYRTWQERFLLDPSVIGSNLTINGVSYTIAGVAPPRFYGDTLRSDPPDFWLPLTGEPEKWRLQSAEAEWLYLLGRLKPGFAPAAVQAHLTAELQQWLGSHREVIPQRDWIDIPLQHIRLTPASRGVEQMQTDYAAGLRLLMTLSGLLLVIACANIANLQLARGSANRPQMAVRLALGAPRSRLIRHLLTESVLLALAGGAVGIYVAYAGTRAILLLAFRGAHYVPIDAQPSLPILGFALLVSLATGIVFGIAPAWVASRVDPDGGLRTTGRSTTDPSALIQKPLMIVQVGVSIVLLIGAGLLTQSLHNLEGQHFGFVTESRVIVSLINPAVAGYTEERLGALYQGLTEALPRIPGVVNGSLSTYSPFEGSNWNERVYIQGKTPDFSGVAPSWLRVGPHYFPSIGTRLLEGRGIEERDAPSAPLVAVINEAFARRFFPNENPLGRRFGTGDVRHSDDYEIVGIVEDAKYQDTKGAAYATFFLPLLQKPPGEPLRGWVSAIELQVAGRVENPERAIRKAIADVDPNLTVRNVVPFGEQVARNFNQERLVTRLTELFGMLALILACVGLYGVTAYGVARRTHEIGIRFALGAARSNVLTLVLRSALAQLGLGLAIGIPIALAASQVLVSQLYGMKRYEPLPFVLAAIVLSACALLAAAIPARRAARIDPMVALRYE